MTEIKPCPFCGEKAETFHIPDNDEQERLEHPKWDWNNPCKWVIGCWTDGCFGNINHVTMTFFNEKDAINTWNRRTENDKSDIQV